jgi:hypothetical protein
VTLILLSNERINNNNNNNIPLLRSLPNRMVEQRHRDAALWRRARACAMSMAVRAAARAARDTLPTPDIACWQIAALVSMRLHRLWSVSLHKRLIATKHLHARSRNQFTRFIHIRNSSIFDLPFVIFVQSVYESTLPNVPSKCGQPLSLGAVSPPPTCHLPNCARATDELYAKIDSGSVISLLSNVGL